MIGTYTFLAFLMGLTSTLFVPTPVGFVSMLDGVTYILAVPLFLTQFRTYNKYFKRFLLLGILWVINAAVSDWYRETPLMVAFKAEMIIVNSITLAIVGYWIMQKSPRALIWFLVGSSISGVISLYHFQNGALLSIAVRNGLMNGENMIDFLVDKQVKPLWMEMFLMAGVFLARRLLRIPWFMCIAAFFVGGFYLLINGGSRSSFLIIVSSAILMGMFIYSSRFYAKVFRKKIVSLVCVVVAAILFSTAYMFMAKNGYLGDEGYDKYLAKKTGASSFMDDRSDILINWPFLWRSPIVGAGSQMIDKWGYVDKSEFVSHFNWAGTPIHYSTFFGHSALVYSWTANGIFGLVIWLYFFWILFEFMGEKMYALGDVAPFVMYGLIGLVWNVLFSPYGGYRGRAMFVAAFLALATDNRFLSWLQNKGQDAQEKLKYSDRLRRH